MPQQAHERFVDRDRTHERSLRIRFASHAHAQQVDRFTPRVADDFVLRAAEEVRESLVVGEGAGPQFLGRETEPSRDGIPAEAFRALFSRDEDRIIEQFG